MSVITYPVSDDQGRESYTGQVSDGEPNGLGILFYNQNDWERRARYEGQFRCQFHQHFMSIFFCIEMFFKCFLHSQFGFVIFLAQKLLLKC